jgi:hypothetical protein
MNQKTFQSAICNQQSEIATLCGLSVLCGLARDPTHNYNLVTFVLFVVKWRICALVKNSGKDLQDRLAGLFLHSTTR